MGDIDETSEKIGANTAALKALEDQVEALTRSWSEHVSAEPERFNRLLANIYGRLIKLEMRLAFQTGNSKGMAVVGVAVLSAMVALAGAVGWLVNALHLKITW